MIVVTAVAGLALLTAAAPAQTALADAVTAELERAVLLDLRLRADPSTDDYRLAAELFGLALELDPENLNFAHRAAEAAWASADPELLLAATRRVVVLDPLDTVAQLRLISEIITRLQTAEERLAAYDRYLGPKGERLDPSVRSRLALDAALLLRELGDTAGFVGRLGDALRLDVTNKDAASLALRYYGELIDEPLGRLELLVNLLYADPLDPHVHEQIAALLAAEGALQSSRRFLDNTLGIHAAAGGPMGELQQQRLALDWQTTGPESVVKEINALLGVQREYARTLWDDAIATDSSTDDLIEPDQTRLELPLEQFRALAAHSAGDAETLAESVADMASTITMATIEIDEAVKAGGDVGAALGQLAALFMDLQTIRLMTGMHADLVAGETAQFAASMPGTAEVLAPLTPWIELHETSPQAALDAVKIMQDELGYSMPLLVAVARERLGDTDLAIENYLAMASRSPLTPVGSWARRRAFALGRTDLRSPAGVELEAFVERVPGWMDRMIRQPETIMTLSIVPSLTTYTVTDQAAVTITLRNLSPIPLALGSGRPIASRMLLTPGVDQRAPKFVGRPQGEVIELSRRLRLMPREALTVTVAPDAGFTGWLLDINSHVTLRQRWRLLQGFRMGLRGSFEKGPLSLVAETQTVVRRAASEARMAPGELAERLAAGDKPTATLSGIRALLLGGRSISEPAGDDEIAQIARAAMARFEAASPDERALMLLVLPHGRQVAGLEVFDRFVESKLSDDALGGGPQGRLLGALIVLTRISDPASPALAAAAMVDGLAGIAGTVRDRLETGRPTLSTVGPEPDALAGPTLGGLRQRELTQGSDE